MIVQPKNYISFVSTETPKFQLHLKSGVKITGEGVFDSKTKEWQVTFRLNSKKAELLQISHVFKKGLCFHVGLYKDSKHVDLTQYRCINLFSMDAKVAKQFLGNTLFRIQKNGTDLELYSSQYKIKI